MLLLVVPLVVVLLAATAGAQAGSTVDIGSSLELFGEFGAW